MRPPAPGASWMLGSLTATPSIQPASSCSAAASAAPAPLETDEAITSVLWGRICATVRPVPVRGL
jgi:hypothetical protein